MSILIVADREGERQVAMARGLSLAQAMGWDAEVVGFCYESLAGLDNVAHKREAKRTLMDRRREEVEAQVARHQPDKVRVKVVIGWEKVVHEWVDTRCARMSHQVVIKTAHHSESFLYTPTDWHLLRECRAPVLIAAEEIWRPTHSIVAAVDLASRSRIKRALNHAIVATARDYAEALDNPLHLVHVVHVPAALKELHLVDEEAHTLKVTDAIRANAARLCKAHGISSAQVLVEHGDVDETIAETARRLQAQLVVMGTVGRQGVNAKLIGNTAEKVLTRIPTDVLALKPGTGTTS